MPYSITKSKSVQCSCGFSVPSIWMDDAGNQQVLNMKVLVYIESCETKSKKPGFKANKSLPLYCCVFTFTADCLHHPIQIRAQFSQWECVQTTCEKFGLHGDKTSIWYTVHLEVARFSKNNSWTFVFLLPMYGCLNEALIYLCTFYQLMCLQKWTWLASGDIKQK